MSKIKLFFKYLLEQPDANSRFVYLVHSLGVTLAMLVLVGAFIFAKDKTGYEAMVLAVAGGGGVAAGVARYATKKGGAEPTVVPTPQPQEEIPKPQV